MRGWGIALAVVGLVLAAAGTARAQSPGGAIPRYVFDVHGVTSALPITSGWVPVAPFELPLPARGFGLDGGAHVYVMRFGPVAFGVGARAVLVRGSSSFEQTAESDPNAPAEAGVTVATRLRTLGPEISLNFGHQLGWSYVSAGIGRARAESDASNEAGAHISGGPPGWTNAHNFGGGARWMLNRHVGFSFDLRWHQLSKVGPTDQYAGAMRTRLLVAGAGISIR